MLTGIKQWTLGKSSARKVVGRVREVSTIGL